MRAEIITACSQGENPLWAKSFFPDDLPEDWQLDYYSNEFSSLFLTSPKLLNNQLLSELEECISEDFRLFIKVQGNFSKTEVGNQIPNNSAITIIGVDSFKTIEQFPGLFFAETIDLAEQSMDTHRCYFYQYDDNSLTPKELRALAEFLLANARHEGDNIYLFFSDNKYTVENCRNMQLLAQML